MSNALVRQALEAKLNTWATAQGYAVAWENTAFTPTSALYLECYVLRSATDSLTLDRLHRSYTGVFQVTVVMPIGTGPGAGEQIATQLDAQFPCSTPITQSGLKLYLTTPMSPARPIQRADRWVLPVSAQYRADTTP